MTVSKRFLTFACAVPLVLVAVLFLALGEARAQQNVCGAVTASNTEITCSAAAYADGIWYNTRWDTPQFSDLTLKIPGASGSPVTITTTGTTFTGTSRDDEAGVFMRVAGDVELIVGGATGGTAHAVQIAQRPGITQSTPTPESGYGIYVLQPNVAATENTEAVTVTLNDGVAIGTSDAAMLHSGVRVQLAKETGTAAHTVTSAARIHATIDGIYLSNSGLGANTLTNTGDIDAGGYGLFLDVLGAATGVASITNRGALTVTGANANGVRLVRTGTGAASITNSGAITSSGSGSMGVFLRHAGTGAMSVENSGAITAGSHGIALSHTGTGESGAISVTNTAKIAAGMTGTTLSHGISVSRTAASGTVSVANSGDITTNGDGMFVDAKGDIAVVNSGNVTGGGHGLFVRGEGAAGTVSVTHSAGEISGGGRQGIFAHVGRWRSEYPIYSGLGYGVAPPAPTSTADLKVIVTGGTVRTLDMYGAIPGGRTAITAWNYENGSVEVDVRQGVKLRSVNNAAIDATLSDQQNTRGRIKVTQAGEITAARGGVHAHVSRSSATGEVRAASAQPLIDIVWTGTYASSEPAIRPVTSVSHAIDRAQDLSALPIFRGAGPTPGIEAEVVAWQRMNWTVSTGDDPGPFAEADAVTDLFDDGADAATKARAAAIVARLRSLLTDETLGTIPGADAIDANDDGSYSDTEITTWLSVDDATRRVLLRNVLWRSLSEKERVVLQAVARRSTTDLNAALADEEAGFSDDYKAAVRALLDEYNVGDIRIAVNGGSIAAGWPESDGIRAYYATPHAMNGAIGVSVAEDATVTGAAAGIYVANAGEGLRLEKKYAPPAVQLANPDAGPDDLVALSDAYPDQVVRVHGTVTGGTDAAVHLAGGGALIVGKAGRVAAGSSGMAVLVNDPGPALIHVDGRVTGGAGAGAAVDLTGGGTVVVGLEGVVDAGGADRSIRSSGGPGEVIVYSTGDVRLRADVDAAFERAVKGGMAGVRTTAARVNDNGVPTGTVRTVLLGEDGRPDTSGLALPGQGAGASAAAPFRCDMAPDRCRLYEALPSVLLAMNGLPSRDERMSAPRDGRGAWARVEAASGQWMAARSTATGLSLDHDRYGVRGGVDVASGDGVRLGVSMHGLRGSAEVASGGEVELSGVGLGASATRLFGGGFHVDAQAAATWYDVDLSLTAAPGSTGQLSKDGTKGLGYAVGVEVGRRVAAAEGVSVTPRAGLAWSAVSLSDFVARDDATARLSLEEAESLTGRAGLSVESVASAGVRLFGSVDVTHEFSEETEAMVSGTPLRASAETTGVRVGIGSQFDLGNGASLRGSADYTSSGSDNSAYGGGLGVTMSF